jgi:hypothetical protein
MSRLTTWIALALLMTACSSDANETKEKIPDVAADRVLFTTSFEDFEGWVAENPSLNKEKAHTGHYSIKVDQNIEFSQTYTNQLARLSPKRFNKVRITAWGYLTAPGAAALVFQITRADQTSVFYEKIDINKVNSWEQVSKVLTLPTVLDPMDQVRIYLWRASATAPAYLDDVKLSVEP